MNYEIYLLSVDALFHFTDRITFLEKIIPSEVLLLNHLKNTKDPQEYKHYDFHPSIYTSKSDLLKVCQIENELNNYFKNFVQIGCFYVNSMESKSAWYKPKIWSDYGDGHKGVCLILSKEKINSELSDLNIFYDIQNVTYNFNPKLLPAPDLKIYQKMGSSRFCYQYVKSNIDIILQKDLDYQNESECRCFVISDNDNRFGIKLNKILNGLIIGDRFPSIYDDILVDFAKFMDIKLYKNNFQAGIGYNLINFV